MGGAEGNREVVDGDREAEVAVEAPESEVVASLVAGAELAAVNGPRSCVVSGDADAVEAGAAALSARGHRTRPLSVARAFHSAHIEPALDELAAVLSTLTWHAPERVVVALGDGDDIDLVRSAALQAGEGRQQIADLVFDVGRDEQGRRGHGVQVAL